MATYTQPQWQDLPTAPGVNLEPAVSSVQDYLNSNPLAVKTAFGTGTAIPTGNAQNAVMNALAAQGGFNNELASQEQQLSQDEQLYKQQQQQPGLTDFLSLGLAGANGVIKANQLQNLANILNNGTYTPSTTSNGLTGNLVNDYGANTNAGYNL